MVEVVGRFPVVVYFITVLDWRVQGSDDPCGCNYIESNDRFNDISDRNVWSLPMAGRQSIASAACTATSLNLRVLWRGPPDRLLDVFSETGTQAPEYRVLIFGFRSEGDLLFALLRHNERITMNAAWRE